MKKYIFKSFFLAIVLGEMLTSCKKSEVVKEMFVDSYINSIVNTSGAPVYVVVHTAYSFSKMSGVSVKGSLSSPLALQNFNGDGFAFYMDVNDQTIYKTSVPSTESFTYSATYSDGMTASKVNSIAGKSLLPAQKLTVTKSQATGTAPVINLTWKPVVSVEAYKVRIFNVDPTSLKNVLIFESNYLVPKDTTTDPSIPFSLDSFSQYNNVVFEVSAFIFESGQDTFEAVSAASISQDISKL